MRTNVYIDGFNLYYRAVKDTPYKWLDLSQLCRLLLPRHRINRIRYFTALVQARPDDLQEPLRQQVYLRALRTIPNLIVHDDGQFRTRTRHRPLANPQPGMPRIVEVSETVEKGSDVNLASYLLLDAFQGDYEQALVISNDSDLATPISLVWRQLHLPVGIVNPNIDPLQRTQSKLIAAATFHRRLRENALRLSQFPPALTDQVGIITKPAAW